MTAKPETCEHRGCERGPATGTTLYNVGKGKFCAEHFTAERAQSPKGKGGK